MSHTKVNYFLMTAADRCTYLTRDHMIPLKMQHMMQRIMLKKICTDFVNKFSVDAVREIVEIGLHHCFH